MFSRRLSADYYPSQYSVYGCGASLERFRYNLSTGSLLCFNTAEEGLISKKMKGRVIKKYPHWVLLEIEGINGMSYRAGYSYFELWKGCSHGL